ncbi:hypothetical protein P7C70_g7364, partial [Phenoliferia sp. Uapishka_3]
FGPAQPQQPAFNFVNPPPPPPPAAGTPGFNLNFNAPPWPRAAANPAPVNGGPAATNEFDDMPPLENVSDTETTPANRPAAAAAQATSSNEFDGMPPLENVSDTETPRRPAPINRSTAAPTTSNEFDDMPPLENVSDNETPPPPTSTQTARPVPVATPAPSQFDDMPPLEREPSMILSHCRRPRAYDSFLKAVPESETRNAVPSLPTPTPQAQPAPTTTPTSPQVDSDDDMPSLEPIDDEEEAGDPDDMPLLEDASDSHESDGDDEDEDEWSDEDGEEDEDEDYSEESDSDEDDTKIYPDGLPEEPLLSVAFTTRPFLHAAREKLYRTVFLSSIWQASLFLRSLSAPSHAARDANELAEMGNEAPANLLGSMVRSLAIVTAPDGPGPVGDISHHRGGASVLIELLERCKELTGLVIRPTFLKSSTKPYLKALRGLTKLQRLDVTGGSDAAKPFLFTTPRIVDLMQCHLFELNDLTIASLRAADEGPSMEEDSMWEDEFYTPEEDEDEEAEDDEVENKQKPSGLKSLKLLDPAVPFSELALILKDSKDTLQTLVLSRPTTRLSRFGLSSLFLRLCSNLTDLRLDIVPTWFPIAKPIISKPPYPTRPKNYVVGKPTDEQLTAIATYPYFLDAVLPYLTHLKTLRFDGALASTSCFSFMPVSIKTVEWAHCTAISPGPLARLLQKTVMRTKTQTLPEYFRSSE